MNIHPISFETLVDLWAGELSGTELDRLEEHLFSCDTCAITSDQIARLVGTMHELIFPVLTRAQIEQLVARGLHVDEVPVVQARGHVARFTPEVDVIVLAMRADVRDAQRVDLEFLDPAGTMHLQFLNVPFDASRGEVLVACQRHYQQYQGAMTDEPWFRLVAHIGGERREVARYAIKHVFV